MFHFLWNENKIIEVAPGVAYQVKPRVHSNTCNYISRQILTISKRHIAHLLAYFHRARQL